MTGLEYPTSKPLVSVIMPAFNAGKYIAESINSVISQTFYNWELIIINDGSIDNTRNIADQFTLNDSRIILINQQNKRLGAARNAGIAAAKGHWIAFLDADDIWVNDKLEKQLLIAKIQPDAGVIFTDGFTFYNDDKETASPYGIKTGLISGEAIYKLEYQGNYIPVLSVMVKKTHLDEIGLQDENPYIYGCEDWDYWLKLAINGTSFYGMKDKLFYYRRHSSNMSNDNNLMNLAKATVFIKNLKKELLTSTEIDKVTGFVNIVICSFIRVGKTKEALFLNNRMYDVSKGFFRKLSSFLISMFSNRSYYLVRMFFKANSLLTSGQ
jgi:teichuronic acid biosynthesis glycosyltransferase TuaG